MLKNNSNISIILKYAKNHWKKEALCVVFILLSVIISLINPLLFRYLIDNIIPKHNITYIIYFIIGFIVINILARVISYYSKYLISIVENSIINDIRYKIYLKVLNQPLAYYKENKMGTVLQKSLNDVEAIRSLWGFLFPTSLSSIFMFIITFSIILKFNWIIAVLSLLTIIFYVFIFRYYNEKIRSLFLSVRQNMDQISSFISESWDGIKEIKIFQYESHQFKKYKQILEKLFNNHVSMAVNRNMSKQLLSFTSFLGPLIVLGVGGYYVMEGEMSIGTLIALHLYVRRLYKPSKDIADIAIDFNQYMVSVSRFSKLLSLESNIKTNKMSLEKNINGNISFHNVSFSYEDNHILNNISFNINKGEVIAIVGETGVGKSTIVDLLFGFIKPANGTIKIDGYDIKDLSLDVLRQHITLVAQDVYLFNTSIYNNVKIGNSNAKEEEILKVINKLKINDFACEMPNGVHSIVVEHGKNLSGGQIQRIAIARSLLKDCPIMLFDEATSAIDSNTEKLIHSAINDLKKEKTIVIISHRLSSLKNADRILVLEEGKIVEKGKVSSLIKNSFYFKKLFQEQLTS